MTNIYLMDLEEEAIVDFVNDHYELYNKTNEHFKEGVSLKTVHHQPQAACQGVQDLI